MTRKSIAYITRQRGSKTQLLVFEHVDFPDAGVQVPKGTVEPGEAIEHAAAREVREETGLTQLDGLHYVGALIQPPFADGGENEERNFFLVHVDGDVPDTWVHHVGGKGEDKGMRFRYYWLSLDPALELAGGQHVGFDFLRTASLKSDAY